MKNFKAVNQVFFITLIAVSLFIGMSAVPRAEAATKVHQVSTVDQLEDAIDDAEANGRPDDIVVKGDQTYALSSALVIDIQDGKKVVIRKKPKSTAMPVLDGVGLYRVFTIKQGEVELRKLKITSGVEDNGGGIYVDGSEVNLKLVDCLIDDNIGHNNGGGIYNRGGTIEIVGSTISNNLAGFGGGIYNGSDSTTGGKIIIRAGSVIEENKADGHGGGIYNGDGDLNFITDTLEIASSIIKNNDTAQYGGGVYNATDGDLTIRVASIIDNNEAGSGGGIDNNGKMTISGDSRVINNTAHNDGGGIENTSSADLTLLDSVVSDNTTVDYGGGIFNSAKLTIKSSFIRNNIAGDGGGIFNHSGATATITHNTSINDNTATNAGGGVFNDAASLTIENDCFIRHNTAGNEGGGILNSDDSDSILTLKNMKITLNTAVDEGGGIYNGNTDAGDLSCTNIINNATNNPDACAPAANCPAACAP